MTIEFKAHGNKCTIDCAYCYEAPMRLAGNVSKGGGYDMDLMLAEVDKAIDRKEAKDVVAFGGEALLLKKPDLERLFAHTVARGCNPGMQSNGALIDEDHIRMFKKYNVLCGISIDGPDEQNDLRFTVSKEKTRETTAKTIENIERLCREGVRVGIIMVLHKLNGSPKNLPKFKKFLRWLGDIGVGSGNIHMMEVDDSMVGALYQLSEQDNINAFVELSEFFEENHDMPAFTPFREMKGGIYYGAEMGTCTFKHCDVMNTQSVYGIEGNGEITNCGMVNKEGIDWVKSSDRQYTRTYILAETPPEHGGCKGCPYFSICTGYCPGSTIDDDWRNKTVFCSTLKGIFGFYEKKAESLGMPLWTKRSDVNEITARYIDTIKHGHYPPVSRIIFDHDNEKSSLTTT